MDKLFFVQYIRIHSAAKVIGYTMFPKKKANGMFLTIYENVVASSHSKTSDSLAHIYYLFQFFFCFFFNFI